MNNYLIFFFFFFFFNLPDPFFYNIIILIGVVFGSSFSCIEELRYFDCCGMNWTDDCKNCQLTMFINPLTLMQLMLFHMNIKNNPHSTHP